MGVFYYAGLLPCLTAALMGYLVSLLMGVPPTRFTVANPGLDAWTMVLVILLAIGCAVASILFCRGLQETGRLAAKLLPSPFVRAFVGGVLVIGLVAVFCGAVNCPIASVFLSIELFGTGDLLYFAMACAISYLLSGYCGLYSSQTILYSKMRAEFINIHTNENEEKHG